MLCILCSYYLFSITHPGKTGTPQIDLSGDDEAEIPSTSSLEGDQQLAIERVIYKVFNKYSINCSDVTEQIRSTFKAKLWRMGNKLSKLGGKRQKVIDAWKDSYWQLTIADASKKLLSRKRSLEKSLDSEVSKRLKLEAEIHELCKKTKEQNNVITALQKENKVVVLHQKPGMNIVHVIKELSVRNLQKVLLQHYQ